MRNVVLKSSVKNKNKRFVTYTPNLQEWIFGSRPFWMNSKSMLFDAGFLLEYTGFCSGATINVLYALMADFSDPA